LRLILTGIISIGPEKVKRGKRLILHCLVFCSVLSSHSVAMSWFLLVHSSQDLWDTGCIFRCYYDR